MPGYANPQTLNRYFYVANRPINLTDPTGHMCSPDDDCGGPHSTASSRIHDWKWRIKHKFGITMSDEGGKSWTATNLSIIYSGLQDIDNALNGTLNSLVGGATFWLKKQTGTGQYRGATHLDGTGIDFYTRGTDAIRQMNIFHEVGHLLDNVPGLKDVFTHAVDHENNPSWVSNGYVNADAALISGRVPDANYGDVDATQAYNPGSSEEWADAFANYVAGNIDLAKPAGASMHNFVTGALFAAPSSLPPSTGI